jgi:hypothetical protein
MVVDVAHGVIQVARSIEEADEPAREASNNSEQSGREALKNLIDHLPVQDRDMRGFKDLLSRTAMHAVARMGRSNAKET